MSSPVVATIGGPATITVASGVISTDGATPGLHASSHASGGSDPVSPSSIGALSVGEGIAYAIALG
jgi:hypothetical protein